ncbi:hypothetical protein ACK3SF_02105 [Candidatus Nanosalina sp. VS9-1]|uniref:hypothetical protein n=1 Tax=Candidatus Nanosalina sp. VS9-1 TaxID=3388566 RepID=UPI0039E10E66
MWQRKGQISFEFVTSMLFVIFILAFIIFTASDQVPEIEQNNERASVNLEASRLTSMLLTSPGYHSHGSGGTEWERDADTLEDIEDVGLASDYHVVERDKVMNLGTVGGDVLNYSRFREITQISNQYRFVFSAMPIVDTSSKFYRTEPPEDPNIVEPENERYINSGNNVGYGSIVMGGTKYNVLVTSHNGRYDTAYMVNDSAREWNFIGAERYGEGDTIELGGREFVVEGFQNSGDQIGNIVILSREIKTFGSQFDVDSTITKISRYAAFKQPGADLQPMKIEVYSWT